MKYDFDIEGTLLKKYNAPILGCDEVATLPDGITEIDRSAFYYIRGLDGVEIPDGVNRIGEEAFYMCEGLKWIKMPSHLDELGARAFAHCHSLREIEIPEGVTEIFENTFYKCERLETVYLPRSLKVIHPGAFYGCYLLDSVVYRGTKTELKQVQGRMGGKRPTICTEYDENETNDRSDFIIENGVLLRYKGKDSTVVVPKIVHTISEHAFDGLFDGSALYRLILPEGLTTVEENAIFFEDWLSEIVIPKSLVSLPYYALMSCSRPIKVIYKGTKAEWNAIKADMEICDLDCVECSDGVF